MNNEGRIEVKDETTLLSRVFREEFSKMVATISKHFGLEHIALAEDLVSETFLQATETWAHKGLPPNPTAWLYTVAKRKTLYHFRRNKILNTKIIPELRAVQADADYTAELDFSPENIKDSQLQMMFAVCNPAIASEAQIGLALRILCGFGIDEIAAAFLTNKETINKRLFRAKERLRTEQVKMELPPENMLTRRLDNVLHIIYLLFNEGYYSKTQNQILRKDLCLEALQLGLMLTAYDPANLPKTKALVALMCFHASRFAARQISENSQVLYDKQDPELWDAALINQGMHFLGLSVQGEEISSYHLEARIASWHCIKEDTREKWEDILQLYNQLLLINYSPSAALNRTFALYKARGWQKALNEAEKLKLDNNHFYFILLGELYKNVDQEKAVLSFQRALSLAKTHIEKRGIQEKIDLIKK
jgi:RNA polymerase sigma-70 factor (ECF subfamily)